MQKTPLFDLHTKLHGKMNDYYGYELPSSYEAGSETEKERVATSCGLFDACFLGELELAGEKPRETLEAIFGGNFDLKAGEIRRVALFEESVDVYAVASGVFMLVVSPATHEKTVKHIRERLVGKTTLLDISNALGSVLVKGPKTDEILKKIAVMPERELSFVTQAIKETSCIVTRLHDGVLITCNFQRIKSVYEEVALVGIPQGLLPCGYEAM